MLIAPLGRDKVSPTVDQSSELAVGDKIEAATGLCWGCMWTESLHSLAGVYNEHLIILRILIKDG